MGQLYKHAGKNFILWAQYLTQLGLINPAIIPINLYCTGLTLFNAGQCAETQ